MTSTVSTESKNVVTRTWADIDPKVAVAAILTAVADLVLVVLFLVGKIDAGTLAAGVGPSTVAVLGAYVKRSTHIDPENVAEDTAEALSAAAPIIDDVAPAAAPIVAIAEDGVSVLQAALAAPLPTTVAPGVLQPGA